jgi:hypothetical protein
MQFDVIGLFLFVLFILPGFLAQRARRSIVPQSLKPLSPVAEVGEFVLAGVWVHVCLIVGFKLWCWIFGGQYFFLLWNTLVYGTPSTFFRSYSAFVFIYLLASLMVGYLFGFVQGWSIIKQPVRSFVVRQPSVNHLLTRLGVPGFLQDDPVWYFVLKQETAESMVFVEVEMKDGNGFYTGALRAYGILDDSEKSKDFYLEEVCFRKDRTVPYIALKCDGILLNFEDVVGVQVRRIASPKAPHDPSSNTATPQLSEDHVA